jgi:hypothetical protein
MLWKSIIFIKLVCYIVTFVYWNIVCTESCVYKFVLKKHTIFKLTLVTTYMFTSFYGYLNSTKIWELTI